MRASVQPLGERELDIIQALWSLETATVAEIHARLVAAGHDVAYTTVQTMLNRLESKGLVAKDSTDRAHRYRPVLEEPTVVHGAIQRLTARFFDGSKEALAAHLVEKDLSPAQLDRIQAIIDRHRRKGGRK
jgi:predicted transcriptional regulator